MYGTTGSQRFGRGVKGAQLCSGNPTSPRQSKAQSKVDRHSEKAFRMVPTCSGCASNSHTCPQHPLAAQLHTCSLRRAPGAEPLSCGDSQQLGKKKTKTPGSSEPQKPSDAALQWHTLFLISSCGPDVEFEIVLPSTRGWVVVPAGLTTSQTSRAPGIFWTEIKMTATRKYNTHPTPPPPPMQLARPTGASVTWRHLVAFQSPYGSVVFSYEQGYE
ncbi:uncharacterized protein Pik3r5l1 [Rattus norvegicus]|uniref:uncharacterized protein Pik3r5l1 n=1 Tax=Rattus norvegicus TaxID=10116 RepID=UPI0003D0D274|nr:uncharacterized protein LOC120095124 [Rattus norvegicus]